MVHVMNTALPGSIKLLVIDIDGTLLNPEGKITTRTRAAIQAAQQAGITFLDDARYNDPTGSAPLATGYSEVVFGELFRDPPLGSRRSFCLWQDVESKLALEDLVLDFLEIQKIHSLFLKFIEAGVAALGGWLEHGDCRGLHCKSVMQIR